MKLNKWLFGAAAALMLGACSDNLSDGPNNPGAETRGSGFVSIEIGMPQMLSTRANDDFDDGLGEEYSVKSLAILFFTGREEEASFLQAYKIENPNADDADGFHTSQITGTKRVTFPVSLTEVQETLWALAVVNYGSIMTVNDAGEVTLLDGNVKFEGNIKEFMSKTTNKDLAGSNGFLMMNTPYSTMKGSGAVAPTGFVHLLALVDKEKIKETEAQAKADPAAEIYVERAVAKVTVKHDKGLSEINGTGIPEIEEIKWVIDNTEPSSYLVRNLVESFDTSEAPAWLTYNTTIANTLNGINYPLYKYRFVGNTPFFTNSDGVSTDMYRIYYGIDPSGDGWTLPTGVEDNLGDNALVVLKDTDPALESKFMNVGTRAPQYCYENTFDVKHQNYYNTTRAVLRVKFKGGEFYTRGSDRKTVYRFEDAAATLAHYVLEDKNVIEAWTKKFNQAITVTMADLDYNTENKIAENDWFKVIYEVNDDNELVIKDFTLYDGVAADEDGTVKKQEVSLIAPEGQTVADVKAESIASINSMANYNAYVNGVAYYAVRIKHFGDDLTPWIPPTYENGENAGKLRPTPTTDESYRISGGETAAQENYLGRYGVLRNNWYELNITDISKLGEPQIKDLPLDGTPDDSNDPEQAISCKINILSWAKRNQNVDL